MSGDFSRIYRHSLWADGRLLSALAAVAVPPPDALRFFAHALGAQLVWLSRLGRPVPASPIWPPADLALITEYHQALKAAWLEYLPELDDVEVARVVHYQNQSGQSFSQPVGDILTHVAMHSMYHRGQVSWELRRAGIAPPAIDLIVALRDNVV